MIVKMKATMITISGIEIDNEDEMWGKSKVETAALNRILSFANKNGSCFLWSKMDNTMRVY